MQASYWDRKVNQLPLGNRRVDPLQTTQLYLLDLKQELVRVHRGSLFDIASDHGA